MYEHMHIHKTHICTHTVTGKHTHMHAHSNMHTYVPDTYVHTSEHKHTQTHTHKHTHYCINHFNNKNMRSILVTKSTNANYQNTNGSPTKR